MRERLKSIDTLFDVDERNLAFCRINPETGEIAHLTLKDHYADIQQYTLEEFVPEDIATQYDIARNIYLYAWFEYRFYNVAESKLFAVLELALKSRIGKKEIRTYIRKREKECLCEKGLKIRLNVGLKLLMEYCRDSKLVSNQGFSAWDRSGKQKAYNEAMSKQMDWADSEMERTAKDEIILPEINIEDLPPDPNYDHVQHLIDHTNKIRNIYAHGSKMLYKDVLQTFEMVSEFINQIYSFQDISSNAISEDKP